MSNYPAFLVSENPMADETHGHRVFIVYTRGPIIMAQAHHLGLEDEYGVPQIGSVTTHGIERVVLEARFVAPAEADANKLTKIMRRMADWYRAYLEWEDSK